MVSNSANCENGLMFIHVTSAVTMPGAIYFPQVQVAMVQYDGEPELSNFTLLNGGSLTSAMEGNDLWFFFARFAESDFLDTHLPLP